MTQKFVCESLFWWAIHRTNFQGCRVVQHAWIRRNTTKTWLGIYKTQYDTRKVGFPPSPTLTPVPHHLGFSLYFSSLSRLLALFAHPAAFFFCTSVLYLRQHGKESEALILIRGGDTLDGSTSDSCVLVVISTCKKLYPVRLVSDLKKPQHD